jgi:hypothetical protein
MTTVLEGYITEDQCSVVLFFLFTKELSTKDINKEMFLVYAEKCLSRKAVQNRV